MIAEDYLLRASVLAIIKPERIGRVKDMTGAVLYRALNAAALASGTSHFLDRGWTAG